MYRVAVICLVLLAGGGFAGCERKYRPDPMATIEEPEDLRSSLAMGDPRDAAQLLHGFYDAEQNAWRWTKRRFGVSLRPPPGAALEGASLRMVFTIPDAAAEVMTGVEIQATVSGVKLEPFRAGGAGEQEYKAAAPREALAGEAVTVEFELSKAVAPGVLDGRELGLVVSSIRFAEP